MYYALNSTFKKPTLKSVEQPRTQEFAQLLVNALGYQGAMEQATERHWDSVADTIRFLAGESIRRY